MESKDYFLFDNEYNIIRCSLRGKFQKDFNLKRGKLFKLDIAMVGDYVEYELNQDGTGVINSIEERENYISRKAPRMKGASTRGERLEQVIASNIDQNVIITSSDMPRFNNKTLDRFLVSSESSHIQSLIVINKIDLTDPEEVELWRELYTSIGYKVILSSTISNIGLDRISDEIKGKKNLFWGNSGVGKSSILNHLFPELNLRIGEVSDFTSKGKHTTVTSVMHKVDSDTLIIDTPGIREIDPYGLTEEDLSHYFIEFQEYINECKYNRCTHNHEPGCAVLIALEKGEISIERYESYLTILNTIEEDMNY
ncbi:MAG: ribosome small subunit-dependent GTPase A [Melioribacteraceae bacterium]|nr:ribosome small subunit-dependent GTPase A [Melioribacteraceae bacterium]